MPQTPGQTQTTPPWKKENSLYPHMITCRHVSMINFDSVKHIFCEYSGSTIYIVKMLEFTLISQYFNQ